MKNSDHGENFHRASLLSEFIPPHEFVGIVNLLMLLRIPSRTRELSVLL